MKKKAAMILIGGLIACLMGGCGQEEIDPVTMETADEVEEEVAEPAVEEEAEPEAEVAEPVDEENAEDTLTDDGSFTEIEISEDGSVNGQEFPKIAQAVIDHDKSEETGVNSTSCFDLDQYLDENGEAPDDWTYESKEGTEYSGRWAYPVVTPCRFFTDLELNDRTDREEWFSASDSETGVFLSMFIYSGLDLYNDTHSYVGETYDDPNMPVTTLKFTAKTADGTTDVLEERAVSYISWDDSEEEEEYIMYSYYFNVGNFSVCVCWDYDEPLSEDEVQLIVDNVSLTTGMER